jgi:uncharacterized protein (UPF0210 family)
MKIRSITCFVNPHWPLEESRLEQAGAFLRAARPAFEQAGYEVQTARLASVPFPELAAGDRPEELLSLATGLEKSASNQGFEYVSLGPALPAYPASYALVPEIIKATENVFLSGIMATGEDGISLPAVQACARIIRQAATITPDGFANLRFTALANVSSGSPFFPAAYHQGDAPAFALATEAADLAVDAFQHAGSLAQARQNLIEAVEGHAKKLSEVSRELAGQSGFVFNGIDFSLAPFPAVMQSLGHAMELLGVPAAGLSGSLAAAAFIADAIDRANIQRTGFSGLMLPVLEDAVLAQRAAQGVLSISDLLLYSSVCGTGLDTLPLPGDASAEQLAAVLLDLAALAVRLDKPLTARLMPIPGKKSGDATNFEFGYFANSRVIPLPAAPLNGLFGGSEVFTLQPRNRAHKRQ